MDDGELMAAPLRIAVIVGTRPEAIKLMPVIVAARARPAQFEITIIRTGQHREMVDDLMDEFGLEADFDLRVMRHNQDLGHVLSESLRGLSDLIARARPDWVLVQGDTATTFAGALAAFHHRVRVGHVEAGLRTGKRHSPFPEETYRSMTARLADLHFAPTEQARANLLKEGIADGDIVMTGNTVVDALLQTLARAKEAGAAVALEGPARYILVTAHRRESHGPALGRICDALEQLLARDPELGAWVPMHPSPNVRSVLTARLGGHPRVRLTEPLGYRAFVQALADAALVLTDSGGVQEECAALGRPVLVMREDTERPEALAAGVAILVGTDTAQIVETGAGLLDDAERYRRMARPSAAFGSGSASTHILDAILQAEPARPSSP
jgi:UDP-N-acetylglucosamine 2-epimerase (non-hydrolysing)